jgi:hypothetical protein
LFLWATSIVVCFALINISYIKQAKNTFFQK